MVGDFVVGDGILRCGVLLLTLAGDEDFYIVECIT